MSQVHSVTHVPVHSLPLGAFAVAVCSPEDQGRRCGQERGRYKTPHSGDHGEVDESSDRPHVLGIRKSCGALFGVKEFIRQFHCPKHIHDAL